MPIRFPSIDVISIGRAAARSPGSTRPAIRAAARRAPVPVPGPPATAKAATEPTNTDAHLVLGRVSNDLFLDGRMQLDASWPREALAVSGSRSRSG